MKKRLLIISITTILLLISACGDSTTGPSDAGDWFPLAVNNWWYSTMDGCWMNSQGDTLSIWTGSFDTRITALVQHSEGFSVYERRSYRTMTNTTPDSTWTSVDTLCHYFHTTDEELRCYDDTTTAEYNLMVKFPITLHETWLASDSSNTDYEVISLSESVTVAAGTFTDCAVIRETQLTGSTEWITDHYYHRGAGIVKNILSTEGMNGKIELQSYNTQ